MPEFTPDLRSRHILSLPRSPRTRRSDQCGVTSPSRRVFFTFPARLLVDVTPHPWYVHRRMLCAHPCGLRTMEPAKHGSSRRVYPTPPPPLPRADHGPPSHVSQRKIWHPCMLCILFRYLPLPCCPHLRRAIEARDWSRCHTATPCYSLRASQCGSPPHLNTAVAHRMAPSSLGTKRTAQAEQGDKHGKVKICTSEVQ